MRPNTKILAGLAMGVGTLALTAVTASAIAARADDARAAARVQTAMDFRAMPEPEASTPAVTRLVELYGPDSLVETPLQRVSFDLGSVDIDTSRLRSEAKAHMAEAECLAEAVYYEARSESRAGQVAVAQVVTNRVRSKHFPNTICGVVYQGSERKTGCQFSFTCDGSMDRTPRGVAWERSQEVADYVLSQAPKSLVGRSTHYHTTRVNPDWSGTLERTRTVGSHVFYSFPWRERPVASVSLSVAPPPS